MKKISKNLLVRPSTLKTADVPANQNWFELKWMIIVHCQTTSWEWIGWAFRMNFLCPHGLRLTLALPLSFHQSGLYLLCLIYLFPFPFPATKAKAELSCARLEPSHPEPSLMYFFLPDTPLGHGQNSRSLLSGVECMWKLARMETLRFWPVGSCPSQVHVLEETTHIRGARSWGEIISVWLLFSPPTLPLPGPGRFPLPAL